MVIMFEPIVRKEKLIDELPPEAWIFLAEVRYYIETRLKLLQDEIDNEEINASEEAPPCTMVYFNPGKISFLGYSTILKEKMNACFDLDNLPRDIELIWLKFDENIRRLFN